MFVDDRFSLQSKQKFTNRNIQDSAGFYTKLYSGWSLKGSGNGGFSKSQSTGNPKELKQRLCVRSWPPDSVFKAACKAVMALIGIIIINRGIQQEKGVGL